MINGDFIFPAACGLSWALTAITGVSVVSDYILPDPIAGQGVYVGGPVSPDTNVIVNWTIDKRTTCPGQTARVWEGVDGFHISEALKPTGLPLTDGPKEFHIPTSIPELAPDGDLSLTIKGYYQCDNSQKEWFELGPVVFTVETGT